MAVLAGVAALATAPAQAPGEDAAGISGKRPKLIASDTASSASPIPFWGKVDCENGERHRRLGEGGDPWPTATGSAQGNDGFRRMTVLDGDDYWGERCELGFNSYRGRVAFYRERRRRITWISVRLPRSFPLGTIHWQGVMQMKQSGPSDNSSGPPVLSLSAYDGRWQLWHSPPGKTMKENMLWDAPAAAGRWTRFAFDVRYSRSKRKGRITVFADLNGDRDFADPGERSRRIRTNTLKLETRGTRTDGLRRGQSIPSHLRAGIHHDPVIPCPAPEGCAADVDNVQVLAP